MYRSVSGRPAWVSLGPDSYLGCSVSSCSSVPCYWHLYDPSRSSGRITHYIDECIGLPTKDSAEHHIYLTDHNPHRELFDSVEFVFASGESYPYIIKAPNGTIALLPILGNQVPSSYDEFALVGTLESTVTKDGAGASASYFADYSRVWRLKNRHL